WVSSYEGVMPFRVNESEHPHINYRNMPIRGLYELTRLASHSRGVLKDVICPVTIVQSSDDQIVDPQSARIIEKKLGSQEVNVQWVDSDRHGILNEDVAGTQSLVIDSLQTMADLKGHDA
ncbi:MAG: alpha/beta hydrolase, partial [Pseudomonadota bacterium]